MLAICIGVLALAWELLKVVNIARDRPKLERCLVNVREINRSILTYAFDYDDGLPPPDIWMAVTEMYHKDPDTLKCPKVNLTTGGMWRYSPDPYAVKAGEFGYAFNSNLRGKRISKISDSCVLVFESTNLSWNAHAPFGSAPNPNRHPKGVVTGFADGSSKLVEQSATAGLRGVP